MNNRNYEVGYAILRIELGSAPLQAAEDQARLVDSWNCRVTVKKIVRDQVFAQQEVERLNRLPVPSKGGCIYFMQYTRVFDFTPSPAADTHT